MDVYEERVRALTKNGGVSPLPPDPSSSPSLPPPAAIARVSPGNIRSLILEKEKELHDINEYRIRTLESLLREKETAANAYKHKFIKLQEDFKYNLKLLEGRDEELALYDTSFAQVKSVLRDREGEVSELKAQLADAAADLKQEQKRTQEIEATFQQKLKDARAQMEGARWTFDDELRRARDEMEQYKRKMDRQLREQQEDLETQRREITLTFDDMMRQRESEFKTTMDEYQSKTRELELKLKATQRECEMSKDRCEELKIKMENMAKLVSESEKDLKSMEWQLSDVRAAKDAKINELEREIVKLQEIKQSLLDEYEAKMAELLQSLHSVEKAFVQQKAQYEEDLQRQLKKREEDTQSLSVRMDGKVQSLMAKLRASESQCESLSAEVKQLQWERDDRVREHEREMERVKQDVEDMEEQKNSIVSELKQQLWTAERETQSLQDTVKELTLQLQMQKEKDALHRQDARESAEKVDDLKREMVTLNLRWESKLQEQEQDLNARHEARVRDLQHARDRIMREKENAEERLVHAENELHRVRTEIIQIKASTRAAETLGLQAPINTSRDGSLPAPSPLWSEDNGTLSPVTGMSPLLTDSPLRVGDSTSSMTMEALSAENAKLKELIRQMKDALAQQAQDVERSIAASPEALRGSASDLTMKLALADKSCVLLEAKLQEAESKLQAQAVQLSKTSDELRLCQAQLVRTHDELQAVQKRCESLEAELGQAKTQSQGSALNSEQTLTSARVSELQRQLSSAQSDVERLVKERTQLMEMSNQLTAELRKLKESPPSSNVEFSGKKDYENMIAELSRSLEEARVHNKTLKKELRRMVKLQVMTNGGQSGEEGDDGGMRSRSTSIASTAAGESRRRPSTLSMMKALESSQNSDVASRRSSIASSVTTNGQGFDEELLSLVRSKRAPVTASPSVAQAQQQQHQPASRRISTSTIPQRRQTVVPPSIPEDEAEQEEEDEEEESVHEFTERDVDEQGRQPATTGGASSLSRLFQRDRVDSTTSSGEASHARVSDARIRLQQAKEMLLLAGKKAERTSSLVSFANSVQSGDGTTSTPATSRASIAVKLSDRETPSQKSAIKKLKELQTKRAEMVQERKKVRNYSLAT